MVFKYKNNKYVNMYEELVANNYNFQYQQAQIYYKNKKEQMKNNLATSILKMKPDENIDLIEKNAEDIMERLVIKNMPVASAVQKKAADKLLQDIENGLQGVSLSNSLLLELQNAVTKASSTNRALGGTQKKADTEYENYTSAFIQRLKTQIQNQPQLNTEMNNILQRYQKQGKNLSVQDKTINSFIYRRLLELLLPNALPKMWSLGREQYIYALSGYFHEKGVKKVLKNQVLPQLKKLSLTNNQKKYFIQSSGEWTIQGKESSEDILFNISLGMNEKDLKKVFNQTYEDNIEVDLDPIIYPIGQATKEIFGTQIKSFELNPVKGTIRPYLPIGSRGILLQAFEKSSYYSNNLVSSIAFLGQLENIVQSLGAHNVMFIDGKQSYWMYDFIEDFRKKRFYLSFNKPVNKDFNSEVALYRYTISRKLN